MKQFRNQKKYQGGFIDAVVGAVAGSVVDGLFSKSSARDQMDFQEEMSSTAHQREVADLRAAGLNPVLSAKYGGASTPGGAGWSTNIAQGVASGFAAAKAQQEAENKKAELPNIAKTGQLIDQQKQTAAAQEIATTRQGAKASAEYNRIIEETRWQQNQNEIQEAELKKSAIDEALYAGPDGPMLRIAEKLSPILSSAASGMNILKLFKPGKR